MTVINLFVDNFRGDENEQPISRHNGNIRLRSGSCGNSAIADNNEFSLDYKGSGK